MCRNSSSIVKEILSYSNPERLTSDFLNKSKTMDLTKQSSTPDMLKSRALSE